MDRRCLDVKGVSKTFNGREVLHSVDFTLEPGITGILGPNGAGKSTLLSILASMLRPTRGTVSFGGINAFEDTERYRNMVGFLPQQFELFPNLSPYEFFQIMGMIKGLSKCDMEAEIEYMANELNIAEVLMDYRISSLSGGTVQRVAIAAALLGKPPLILLDEPSAGLDLEERIRLRLVLERIARNACVVISTHITQDLELACSKILVLHHGSIICNEAPKNLLQGIEGYVRSIKIPEEEFCDFTKKYPVLSCSPLSSGSLIVRAIVDNGLDEGVECDPTLEDAYVALMRKGFKDERNK